eukprot:9104328-Pyramimonas_sp.AAC.1
MAVQPTTLDELAPSIRLSTWSSEHNVVAKAIKQAGKRRLAEALDTYCPKPKDMRVDGRAAFAQLKPQEVL